jgi:hypothetical protein
VSRAENILIGVAIAAVVSYVLYPTWLRTSVPGVVAHAVDAIAGQLGLEPGSGSLALVLGEAGAAAARLLDTIIALKQVLDRTGPDQQASAAAAVIGHASDVLSRMSAAIAGPEPPTRAAADAPVGQQRNPADAPATAAEGTPRGPGSAPAQEARGPQPVLLLFALEQLTDAIATFRGVLGRLPASATQICWAM